MDVDALNLVKLVKARPAIYITKKQGDKAKLWQEIAAEMNWSVSECKKKWLCLRIAYCRYVRGETRTLNRLGRERRKWYLADPLSFLKHHVRASRSDSNSLDIEEFQKKIGSCLDESLYSITSSEEQVLNTTTPFKGVKYELSPETKDHLIDGFTQEAGREVTFAPPEDRGEDYFQERSLGRPQEEAGREVTFAQPEDREKVYFPECSLGKPQEDANLLYFQSLFADYCRLSSRRQRAFKMHMLSKLQELQEEDETELVNMRRPPQSGPPANTTFESWQN
ncbi:unnamed protein product [Ceratitis capitata]|uniref:(Mediterranean fruit fly) hypothetical protein n=1 Tax=Ceratitis capitata TaxID=7213 RepID=A0A811UYT2_CERCA|nr:unnamed protein product [Ceratitis capitata]